MILSPLLVKETILWYNICIYIIMKTMCPPGHHHNGFAATHALGHTNYGYTLLTPMNEKVMDHLRPVILCSLLSLLSSFCILHFFIYINNSRFVLPVNTRKYCNTFSLFKVASVVNIKLGFMY